MLRFKKRLIESAEQKKDLLALVQRFIPDAHYVPRESIEYSVGEIDDDIFYMEPVHEVPLHNITITQEHIQGKSFHDGDPISVLKYDGNLYLFDGHHRYAEALQRGEDSILAHIVDLDRN